MVNKRSLIRKITTKLAGELEVYFRAAQFARAEATHEQNKAEHKYDTRGLEASYLARGQSRQAAEIEAAIAEFAKLDPRPFAPGEPIGLGALVELTHQGETDLYFIGPRAGGTEVVHDRKEILVITPQSPLGEQLMGRKQGDQPELNFGGARPASSMSPRSCERESSSQVPGHGRCPVARP
jgi:transcription elongation GreA/GreB family factor